MKPFTGTVSSFSANSEEMGLSPVDEQ